MQRLYPRGALSNIGGFIFIGVDVVMDIEEELRVLRERLDRIERKSHIKKVTDLGGTYYVWE